MIYFTNLHLFTDVVYTSGFILRAVRMWLLDPETLETIEDAAGQYPTAEQQETYLRDFNSEILSMAGSTAQITVQGVLTDKPDFFAELFGGGNTVYSDIRAALANADADPEVSKIILSVDSPGGQAGAEWLATIDAVYNTRKPVEARIGSLGASAAYGIASQADTVMAANRMTRVGSIGVAARIYRNDSMVTVTSTNAPDKAPDITKPSGLKVVRAELDDIHDVFVEAVARGRNRKKSDVNKNFGRGATVLAAKALGAGMIDSIGGQVAQKDEETKPMNMADFKAEHADLYAEVFDLGVASEKDRVCAHLIMGEKSGDMKTAVQAINSGDGMTATIQAKYLTAAMNKSDISSRHEENAGSVVATEPEEIEDLGAQVCDLIEKELGIAVGE